MKISILGFNLFAAGGTTQSNLNLIHEFVDLGYEVTYYNFAEFSRMDLIALQYNDECMKHVSFKKLTHLIENDTQPADYYYITRESFFPLAKILRSMFQEAKIIGEIHAPLALIKTDFTEYLPYFSYIRVGTESIRQSFIERFNFKHVFTQKVSLYHIEPVKEAVSSTTKNLLIFSRFSENEKDISYAIRLIDYVVNYLKQKDIHLYINGYGAGEVLYKNLIGYYGIQKNVHINTHKPEHYIYLSTSPRETLGYSIMEALSKGHPALLYPGDDDVVKEVYKEFKTVEWLKKNLEADGRTLLALTEKLPQQTDFVFDRNIIQSFKEGYVKNFLAHTAAPIPFDTKLSRPLKEQEIEQLMESITTTTVPDDLREYRLMYYSMKEWPILGPIIKSEWVRLHSKRFIEKFLAHTKNRNNSLNKIQEDHYFIESFHGKNFSGDPKQLALAIQKKYPDSTFFVSSINQLVDLDIRSYGFIPVRTGSKEYLNSFSESKYIIINGNSLDSAGKKEGQVFIQTWHGLPMKKMVNDLENLEERKKEAEAFAPRMQKWDYLITSGSYNTSLLHSSFALKANRRLTILETGAPRNAYLLNKGNSLEEKERIYWKYFNRPYDSDKTFILFCPTWRKDNRKNVSNIDLKAVIDSLPENYEIIVKLHPLEGNLRKKYAFLDERIHCFYNELVDIQELYLLSTVLISDYSSAIFDYAHLGRKIIVMQEDSRKYEQEIGWYFDIEEMCHLYGSSYSSQELTEKILETDSSLYNQRITEKLLQNDSSLSTEEVLKTIFKGAAAK